MAPATPAPAEVIPGSIAAAGAGIGAGSGAPMLLTPQDQGTANKLVCSMCGKNNFANVTEFSLHASTCVGTTTTDNLAGK